MKIVKLNNSSYDANAYLVNGKILIDVGMDGKSILTELKKIIPLTDLETIIITHCHYDHSGGAEEVALATGAKIAIHKEDGALLKDPNSSASKFFGKKAPDIKIDILLKGGEMFGPLEVIHTPGHTPGGICLYDAATKTLFSGDTVFEDGSFGRTDLYGGDQIKLIESIRKLTLLDVAKMYPGHGNIIMDNANEHIRLSLAMASQF